MRSHRGGWLGSTILAAAIVLLPAAATTVRAQPGFGPDPFWPYNNQYTPYVTPMGPAGPAGGQGGALFQRNGVRGANRFQNYLDDLETPGRNFSDRSNIGMPYYRSSVDPALETKDKVLRQYTPNMNTGESFDESQRRVAETYFRYYAERDPARRAQLLKEYRTARRDAALALSGRGRSPARDRDLDSPAPSGAASRRGARTGSAAPRAGGTDRTRAQADRIPPAPEVPRLGTRRFSGTGTGASTTPRRATPTDILNRSRAMDRADGIDRGPRSSGPSSTDVLNRSRAMDRADGVDPGRGLSSPSSLLPGRGARRPAPTSDDDDNEP
jgi:hypothetical protein